jgi:hypothetical protein
MTLCHAYLLRQEPRPAEGRERRCAEVISSARHH